MFANSSILCTGGCGSLGQHLTKKLLTLNPKEIRIYSRDEFKQYNMRKEISDDRVKYFLGDVRDLSRLTEVMSGVDYVVHAAAYKQIDTIEPQPMEAVKTNILGSENVIIAANFNKVKKCVLISTDKAVEPRNAYGATKMLAERLFTTQYNSDVCFSCVRYGNVLSSRGSVIPAWQHAAKKGKEINITDPEMTRFWITLDEAVELVLFALSQNVQGRIYVPKIPSMKITDLAKAVAPDSSIKITGIRSGEKIHESLVGMDISNVWMKDGDKCYQATGDFTSDKNDKWLGVEDIRKMI